MSQKDKRIERIKKKPKDYTYTEAKSLVAIFGYEERSKGKTSGSRVMFYRREDELSILLHKPHPGDVMKEWMVEELLNSLIENGDIDEE